MDTNKLIIEVGANSGTDTERYASELNTIVMAFEPHPGLYRELMNRFQDKRNVMLFCAAVSDYEGVSQFHLSELGDKGTSSLFEYHDDLLKTPLKQYPWYEAGFASHVRVPVVTLEKILDNNSDLLENYRDITYLHIDAQGSDFAVIRGLGRYLKYVKAGRCEATYGISLYKNTENDWKSIKEYLENNGFEVKVAYIHEHNSECDLEFVRKD
jgi:FkbM family methyltransferase